LRCADGVALHHLDRLLGDKGYDGNDIRADLAERGIEARHRLNTIAKHISGAI